MGPSCVRWDWNPRGRAMTPDEFADFLRNGGKINYGEARLAKQQQLDERYERRRGRSELFDIVADVVASWDSADYIAKQRKIVRGVLALPRNARRRQLSELPTKARRHQQAIRLVYALVFDGLSRAEYCRRHELDPVSASRMLARLCEKEPGLRNGIGAISACAATTSWQNRQQERMLRNKEREVRRIYGWDYENIADCGWLPCLSVGSMRSTYGGRFKPTALLREDPFQPLDLHEPSTWLGLVDSYPDWGALSEPVRVVARYEAPPNRYRPIRRAVRLKTKRRQTMDVARVLDGNARPLVYWDRNAWPATNSLDHLRQLTGDARSLVLGLVPIGETASAATLRCRHSLNDEPVFRSTMSAFF